MIILGKSYASVRSSELTSTCFWPSIGQKSWFLKTWYVFFARCSLWEKSKSIFSDCSQPMFTSNCKSKLTEVKIRSETSSVKIGIEDIHTFSAAICGIVQICWIFFATIQLIMVQRKCFKKKWNFGFWLNLLWPLTRLYTRTPLSGNIVVSDQF